MHGELLALDPSIRTCGVALFRGGVLSLTYPIKCSACGGRGRVRDCEVCSASPLTRCLRMAQAVAAWVVTTRACPREFVAEWPRTYRAVRSKGDPNDLLGLCGVAGATAGMLAMAVAGRDVTLKAFSYEPAEWTGQLPKDLHRVQRFKSVRAQRIAGRLSDVELPVWRSIETHDEIDAVGLGLYHLGRFEPHRVFPRH